MIQFLSVCQSKATVYGEMGKAPVLLKIFIEKIEMAEVGSLFQYLT